MDIDLVHNRVLGAVENMRDQSVLIWSETEWAICSRLAQFLKKKFSDYDIDVELRKKNKQRPDIVIHKLGTQANNLVAIEVKKRPSKIDIEMDLQKITSVYFEPPYKYKYGIFISIGELPEELPEFNTDRVRMISVAGWKIVPHDEDVESHELKLI